MCVICTRETIVKVVYYFARSCIVCSHRLYVGIIVDLVRKRIWENCKGWKPADFADEVISNAWQIFECDCCPCVATKDVMQQEKIKDRAYFEDVFHVWYFDFAFRISCVRAVIEVFCSWKLLYKITRFVLLVNWDLIWRNSELCFKNWSNWDFSLRGVLFYLKIFFSIRMVLFCVKLNFYFLEKFQVVHKSKVFGETNIFNWIVIVRTLLWTVRYAYNWKGNFFFGTNWAI